MRNANKSVSQHNFAMVPRADIPRSSFRMMSGLKTTFDAGILYPMYIQEILPGDTFNVNMTAIARMPPLVVPLMDNLHLETFFFFVPNRLVWTNWVKFQGEQDNPGDSTAFIIPNITGSVGGYTPGSIFDYMGLPTVGQVAGGGSVNHSTLPLRAYNLIWNEWFRDENLQTKVNVSKADGGDALADWGLLRRGKRPDYFTGALPFLQKGTSAPLPLGTTAPVIANVASPNPHFSITGDSAFRELHGTAASTAVTWAVAPTAATGTNNVAWTAGLIGVTANSHTGLVADLSAATAATINQLRQSFQVQKVLERDARGGTRYTEAIRSRFGVTSPDARLQRPEYLGGGSTPININTVEQTSASNITGGSTPAGSLSGYGTVTARHGFTQSFTEHGYILGLINVRADLTYQQGINKHWKRSTRFDFYEPAFAMLGEQAILNQEIYCDGTAADQNVFGYQERWAEYRYSPSRITALFKSTSAGTLDYWHSAQKFTALPTLNSSFIVEVPPLSRNLAAGTAANGAQFLADFLFDIKAARPMPMYSVPGLVDHF